MFTGVAAAAVLTAAGAGPAGAFQTGDDAAPVVAPVVASVAVPVANEPPTLDGALSEPAVAAALPAGAEPVATGAGARPAPASESLLLGRAGGSPSERLGVEIDRGADSGSAMGDPGAWARTVGALAAVLALIFVMKLVLQRSAGAVGGLRNSLGAGGRAPSGVVFVLGRYPIARGHSLVLMKVDRRVLVLDQSSAGFRTLSEIVDPEEVASVLVKTRDEEGDSMASKFGEMLRSAERDPSFGDEVESPRSVRRAMSLATEDPSAPRAFDGDETAHARLEAQLRRIRGLTA